MGIAADSLFNVLMSWVRALVNALWALFSADRTTALEFLGKNWMTIAAVIIVCGLVIDWIIWLIRWQPYHLWARKARRLLRLDEPEEEAPKEKARARAAVLPEKRYAPPERTEPADQTPLYLHGFDEEEEESVDGDAAFRRAETDAWQLQMQEEARARAEAEKAEREREAREAEQARLAQAAYEAEQARLAQEAYEAEQARLAQEEYERQMAEYERQKAQYERDLAEYERQKAEYEAQLAAQNAFEAQPEDHPGFAGASRRRRPAAAPEAEAMEATRVQPPGRTAHAKVAQSKPKTKSVVPAKSSRKPESKPDKSGSLLGRVAKMIESEEEEIITRKTLPPRVDMNDAFRTAKLPVVTPTRSGRRKK